MPKIKGILVVPLVKAIRADKHGKVQKYLADADLTIIKGTVCPIIWMDFESYQRIAHAVARENAMNKEKTIRNWEYASAENILKRYHAKMVTNHSTPFSMDGWPSELWPCCFAASASRLPHQWLLWARLVHDDLNATVGSSCAARCAG